MAQISRFVGQQVSRRHAVALAPCIAVTACGSGGAGPTPTPTPPPPPPPPPPPYAQTITIGPGADFPAFAPALATLADRTAATRVLLDVRAGTYVERIALPDFVDMAGAGRDATVIRWDGDPDLRPETRVDNDPIRLRGSNRIAHCTVIARNSNYCLHSESGGGYKDYLQEFTDVHFRHDGNEEAFARGGSAEVRFVPAVGIGMSSGGVIAFTDCLVEGLWGGLYVHNSPNQARPCRLVGRNSAWRAIGALGRGLTTSTTGSGTADLVELDAMDLGDFAAHAGGPAEFDIRGTVTRPFAFSTVADRFRPTIANQELPLRNAGAFAIDLGVMVLYDPASGAGRAAEPSDFAGGAYIGSMKIGIALADIGPGDTGRVQTGGWIDPALTRTNVTVPHLGDGFSAGVHGALVYQGGAGTALTCIREQAADGSGFFSPAILAI